MKFFDFYNPYIALIMAENEEQAKEKYVEWVADDEGDLEFDEIGRDYAIVKFSQAKDEHGNLVPIDEILEQLQSKEPELLVIDGSLI
ncbi:hypothetical protein MKY88_17315 [Lysinibacillus sp. FSL R7-0073]|uniref:hypothetical protein n=1 Tax=Lysinibacillus sp. FSL R7-0073 TaxID=2921669 RepID=UPI0030F6769B